MAPTHICPRCDMPAVKLRRCNGCKKAIYCSEACQKEAWPLHIFDCKPGQPINTAYRLYRSCIRDELPDDEETRRDYGFAKAARTMGGLSENMLCGLFRGVFIYMQVPPRSVHQWRLEGRLLAEIKKLYEPMRPQDRGAYYPWLLEHHSVLDNSIPDDELIVDNASRGIRNAWIKAGGSPSDSFNVIQTKILSLSPPRRSCHVFYRGFIGGGGHPNPVQDEWIDFGFVAALDSSEERNLGIAYKALIGVCTFEEFCVAHETSSIPALFERYGLQPTRFFRDVMAHAPYMRKSVWDLKHYVDLLAEGAASKRSNMPLPSVTADYGYMNCHGKGDQKRLNALYKRYFLHPQMDPIELHNACIQGQLLRYLEPFVGMKAKDVRLYHRLLKTVYPLPQAVDYAGETYSGPVTIYLGGSPKWWKRLFTPRAGLFVTVMTGALAFLVKLLWF